MVSSPHSENSVRDFWLFATFFGPLLSFRQRTELRTGSNGFEPSRLSHHSETLGLRNKE